MQKLATGRSLDSILDGGIGFYGITGNDDAFVVDRPPAYWGQSGVPFHPFTTGDAVRDWSAASYWALWPYDRDVVPLAGLGDTKVFRPYRTPLREGLYFGQTPEKRGMSWYEYSFLNVSRARAKFLIAFAFVATHNHFVLDRGGKIFKQSAPVIKLPEGATEDDHLALLGVLNSSTACFWLKQVSHNKGRPGAEQAGADEPWEHRFEFTGTKLEEFPLPA